MAFGPFHWTTGDHSLRRGIGSGLAAGLAKRMTDHPPNDDARLKGRA